MMSSVIAARLVFQCGHAALVTLPRIKGETSAQRVDRVAREKSAAHTRACDFCAQRLEVVVQQTAPAPPAPVPTPLPPIAAVAPVAPPAEPVPIAAPAPALPAAALPLADWHADRVAKARPRASEVPGAVSAANTPAAKRPVERPPRAAASAQKQQVATPVQSPARNGRVAPPARTGRVVASAKTSTRNGRVAKGARFSVQFQLQTVLDAADMRDALRQAQSLGAIEVLAITRES